MMDTKEDAVNNAPKTRWLLMLNIFVLAIIAPLALLIIFIEVAKDPTQEQQAVVEAQQSVTVVEDKTSEDQKRMSPEQKELARKWLVDFRAEKDKSLEPSVMNSEVMRRETINTLDVLRQAAEILFYHKALSACALASGKLSIAWQTVDSLMTSQVRDAGYSLGGVLFDTHDSGQSYAECREIIDNLK